MKVSWLAARTTRTFCSLVRLPSPLLHARDKRDNFAPRYPLEVNIALYKAIQALARLHLWHLHMALGLVLRRDFMAPLRLNRLAYLPIVVSDLPDDYTNDRASAAPFTAPRRE